MIVTANNIPVPDPIAPVGERGRERGRERETERERENNNGIKIANE